MLTNTWIFTRLAALSGFLLAFVVAITKEAINGMSHMRDGLKTVYEDRAIPLGQLSDILAKYYEIRLAVVGATNSNDVQIVRQRQSDIDAPRKNIDKTWDLYAATIMTPDEKRLVADAVTPSKPMTTPERRSCRPPRRTTSRAPAVLQPTSAATDSATFQRVSTI